MPRPRSASGAVEVVWPGKYGPDGARVEVPARSLGLQVEQVIGGVEAEPTRAPGLLVGGDNLLAMDALMATHAGAIDLVYIDPPFATGHEFERTTRVGADAEGPELRSRAYSDRWPGGVAGLLQMLDPRLRRIHRLLAPHGSLYVHVDPIVGHAVKLLLDEIFGPGCFQREIVWRVGWISGFKARANNWIRNHDLIYFYVKDPQRFVFHRQVNAHPSEYRRRKGEADQQGGVPVEDVWNASPAEWRLRGGDSLDSIQIKSFSREKTGWATQKNESLLRRIVAASSNPGGLVADFFCGAGTTLAAAHALGRRWIGCDSAAAAIELAHARMAEKPGIGFVRAGLGPAERAIWLSGQADPWPAAVLRLRGAQAAGGVTGNAGDAAGAAATGGVTRNAADAARAAATGGVMEIAGDAARAAAAGGVTGIAGDTAVWVGPLDGEVTAAEVAAAATSAAGLGLRKLEVMAWAWSFPAGTELAEGTGVSVVCLQLRRALLDPRGHAGEPPWSERPVVAVTFAVAAAGPGLRVQATLEGARFSAPTRATAALATAGDARAAVEAWSVEFATASPAIGAVARVADGETGLSEAGEGAACSAAGEASTRGVRSGEVQADAETSEQEPALAGEASRAAAAASGESVGEAQARVAAVAPEGLASGESAGAGSASWAIVARPIAEAGEGQSPHRPAFAAARTRNRRELDADSGWLALTGEGPWVARVRLVDVLGGESWHAWRIEHVLQDMSKETCSKGHAPEGMSESIVTSDALVTSREQSA
ncbi:site-specific DNA-methyltransferase [Nannocystis bainbridge]|uniref:site-specific DNA-methyltransferase (adenine-specific) n=1 Tax=Nannocystis bainbridge TaxID=2995303 RepID=A0ABT5E4I2_9BACT|nr:site-specific DNA-methyltransferase [Nannocystis bainbridge]MDC0720645.1 site-specific DNA-methyltransferase [Nannocystis bainbridge]